LGKIYTNDEYIARMEKHVEKRKELIVQEELKKRCELSTKRYKSMGLEKARKLRASAYSRDLRRWL